MNITLTMAVPPEFFYHQLATSAVADIRQHTGQHIAATALAGFNYDKKWANGMVGHLTITHAEPGRRYAYELDTDRDHYIVDYQLEPAGTDQTNLIYQEEITGKTARGQANNRVTGTLLSWLRKRRFKRMAKQMAAAYYD